MPSAELSAAALPGSASATIHFIRLSFMMFYCCIVILTAKMNRGRVGDHSECPICARIIARCWIRQSRTENLTR
jgi:hypothetical protein